MDNVTIYESAWGDFEASIEIRKTPEQLETAQKVGEYLRELPLTVDQNNVLVSLLLEHMEATAKGAFSQGVAFVLKLERGTLDDRSGEALPQ